MRRLLSGLAVAWAIASVATPASGRAALEEVSLRKGAMTKNGVNFGKIAAFVRGKGGTVQNVAMRARAMARSVARFPNHFPAGTSNAELGSKTTRARPEIWTDWDAFRNAAGKARALSLALARVAERGDEQAVRAAFHNLGRQGCAGCHDRFRAPKSR